MSDNNTQKACDLCGATSNTVLFEAFDRLYGCQGSFTYVRCDNCGLVFMNPQIPESRLSNYYPQDYTPHLSVKQPSVSEIELHHCVLEKLNSDSKLLDVGCGSGKFLHLIKTVTDCKVFGIDNSQNAVQAAKTNYDIDVFEGIIADAPFDSHTFDAVTAWWVLEHVPNPSQVLSKISELLKPDGDCVIAIPNIASFNAGVFKNKWYHLDCPRHLYLYSPETITKLLDKAGMRVYKIVFEKKAKGIVQSLRNCSKNTTPLKHRKKPKGLSTLRRLLFPFAVIIAMLGKSDTMVVYAKPKK